VVDEVGIARIVEHGSKLLGQADPFVELPQRQQAGIRGKRSVRDLNLHGQGLEKVERERGGWLSVQGKPPWF
jgi:hypothetical protein